MIRLLIAIPVYAFTRAFGMLYAGVRLVLVMAPVLAVGLYLAERPGHSREVRDLIAITSGFAGLGFLFWLALTRRPREGERPSLRCRYARFAGIEPRRPAR